MADDFEREHEDELDALLDMEEEVGTEFDPFPTKSRKSLNFSTPSNQRSQKKTPNNNNLNNSILNDSFPTPLAVDSPKVGDGRTSAMKRRQEEMFGELSNDSDTEGGLTIDADLPDIVHKSKRPKPNTKTPEAQLVDDFQITPPPSPTPLEKAIRLQATRARNKQQLETKSDYQDRITADYDLERQRVLRLRPREEDYVNVTSPDGIRVYMTVKDDVTQAEEIERLTAGHKQLQLLGAPLHTLKAQVEERKSRRLAEELERLENLVNAEENEQEDEDVEIEKEVPGKPSLWVDRYSPHHYTDLLSDESTNRLILKWLKQWDYVVFGKECKLPKGEQNKDKQQEKKEDHKKKDGKGFKPFKGKYEPEVLDELDEHKRPLNKVSLLCGPPGLGKTTLAHVIARHAGYNIVEINASDDRSADVFKTKIEAATQMKAVIGQDPRPNCLIIDEIDGAPQPAINMLISIIKGPEATTGKKKKKKGNLLLRPIICICNDVYAPALRQLRPLALNVTFPPTVSTKLANRLQQISRAEHLRADLTALLALCEKADNDIRSCLNTLQFVRSKSKELTLAAVNSVSVGQKDQHKSLFTVWQSIFTMPKPKRKRYVNPHDRENLPLKELEEMSTVNHNNLSYHSRFNNSLALSQASGESEKVMQGLYENYLLAKVKDPRMDMVQLANSWLCTVDIMNREVLSTQNYILFRYTQYLPVAFHMMFASNHHPKILYPHSQFETQTKYTKSKDLMEAMIQDMAPSVRKNVNLNVAVMELLPPLLDIIQPNLRPVNTQLYSQREKAELSQLIRIMIAYNMSYVQERTMDGQYVYNLDPCVDGVARLPGLKQPKQLTYAAKQLISREIELEKMRRTEMKKEINAKPVAPPVQSKGKQAEGQEKAVPNHLQTLKPKAVDTTGDQTRGRKEINVDKAKSPSGKMLKQEIGLEDLTTENVINATLWQDASLHYITEGMILKIHDSKISKSDFDNQLEINVNYSDNVVHVVDFFGRKVKVDAERPNTKAKVASKEVIGGDIWFRFKEGFTNAVRRTVRVSEFV